MVDPLLDMPFLHVYVQYLFEFSTAAAMMRAEFGYCMICDKEIAKKCDSCDAKIKTPDYTEVQVEWSNGSKMKIGVCVDCATNHKWATPEAKKGIMQTHWDYWDKKGGAYDKEVVLV